MEGYEVCAVALDINRGNVNVTARTNLIFDNNGHNLIIPAYGGGRDELRNSRNQ